MILLVPGSKFSFDYFTISVKYYNILDTELMAVVNSSAKPLIYTPFATLCIITRDTGALIVVVHP